MKGAKKRMIWIQAILCAAMAAASCQDMAETEPVSEPEPDITVWPVMRAVADDGGATRVYVDGDMRTLWNKGDMVSLFNRSTYNKKYMFGGEDGDNAGDLLPQDNGAYHVASEMPRAFAVYPYSEDNRGETDGTLLLTYPARQTYREGTYGPGANVMVSTTASDDKILRFKNAVSYLMIRLYGEGVSVSGITVRSNGGEALSGRAAVTIEPGGDPITVMIPTASADTVSLSCDPPVELGKTADDATVFWITVPPDTLESGITVTVLGSKGERMTRSAGKALEMRRNKITRMSALEVTPSLDPEARPWIMSVSRPGTVVLVDRDAADTTSLSVTVPDVTDMSSLTLDIKIPEGVMIKEGEIRSSGGALTMDATSPVKLDVTNGTETVTYTLRVRNTGLPVVRLDTPDGAEINDKENWMAGASMRIENPDGTTDTETTLSVKGRGNITWSFPKKPYALKLDAKAKILGMPSHKRWILLPNWRDRTLMRNDAAFWLSERMEGIGYTPRGRYVELVLNGRHMGNYYLCEQIKIGKNRVNITEMAAGESADSVIWKGGFLMEVDPYDMSDEAKWTNEWGTYGGWNEVTPKFITDRYHMPVNFKQPDEKDISDAQYNYMRWYYNHVEELLNTPANSGDQGVTYTLSDHECAGDAATAVDTGIRLFDGSYPGGFRITADIDIPSDELSKNGMATWLSCMSEAGSPWPGIMLRHSQSASAQGEAALNPGGGTGQFNIKESNHIVITYTNKTLTLTVNGATRTFKASSEPSHAYPLTIGGTYGTKPGEWKEGRFAKCVVKSLTVERIDGRISHEWASWLDPVTMIDFMIVNELAGNQDIYNTWPSYGPEPGKMIYAGAAEGWKKKVPHSMYMHKDGSLLKFGPVWDFDWRGFSPELAGQWLAFDQHPWYVQAMKDPEFKAMLIERWDMQKEALRGLTAHIRETAETIALSERINSELWPIENNEHYTITPDNTNWDESLTFGEAVERIIRAFETKWGFVDTNIKNL